MKNPAFEGEIYTFQSLGEMLCPAVFEPSVVLAAPNHVLDGQGSAASPLRTLTRELLERFVEAWELSYYGLPTSGYEAYLTDDSFRWIALELRLGNPVFGENGGYVQLLGEQLASGFFEGANGPRPQDQMSVDECDDVTQEIGRSV